MTAGNAAYRASSPSKDHGRLIAAPRPGVDRAANPDLMPAPDEHAMIAPRENITSSAPF